MQRWNGWGDESVNMAVAPEGLKILRDLTGTHTIRAELPYVAQNEQIRHLTDLLLRRVRIGSLTPEGGKAYLKRIRKLCQNVLPWDRHCARFTIKLHPKGAATQFCNSMNRRLL